MEKISTDIRPRIIGPSSLISYHYIKDGSSYLWFPKLRTDGHSYPNGGGWCIIHCSLGLDIIITCGSPSSALMATATPIVVVGALPTAPWERTLLLPVVLPARHWRPQLPQWWWLVHYWLLPGTGHYYYLWFSQFHTDGHSYPNCGGWCITNCSLGPDIIITCGSPSSTLMATAIPMVVVGALPTAHWDRTLLLPAVLPAPHWRPQLPQW